MSNWNAPLGGIPECSAVSSNATSLGLALTTSYQTFIAATAYEWEGFTVLFASRATGVNSDFSVALGSAAAEYPLVDRMMLGNNGSSYGYGFTMHFPLRVPKDSRVAMKLGASVTTQYGYIIGNSGNMPGAVASGAFLERLGTAGTGVNLDPGGVANTKGAWVSVGTLANAWKGMYVNFNDDAGTSIDYLADISVDIGGVKQIIYGDIPICKGSGNTVRQTLGPLACDLPAGAVLYARVQATSTSSGSRDMRVNLHGIVA